MIEIYGTKIKQSVYQLEQMIIETDKLCAHMQKTRDTLKLINDDLEADRLAHDSWADKKEQEIILAMEAVENQKSKYGEVA